MERVLSALPNVLQALITSQRAPVFRAFSAAKINGDLSGRLSNGIISERRRRRSFDVRRGDFLPLPATLLKKTHKTQGFLQNGSSGGVAVAAKIRYYFA